MNLYEYVINRIAGLEWTAAQAIAWLLMHSVRLTDEQKNALREYESEVQQESSNRI